MQKHLADVRQDELKNVRTIGNWRAYMTGITFVQPLLASVLTFVTYTLLGNPLTPAIVFSSIAMFNTLRFPLLMLPMVLTTTADAMVSLGRIAGLLLAEEIGDEGNGEDAVVEEGGNGETKEDWAIKLSNASFKWESAPPKPAGQGGKFKGKERGRAGPGKSDNNATFVNGQTIGTQNGTLRNTATNGGIGEATLIAGALTPAAPGPSSFRTWVGRTLGRTKRRRVINDAARTAVQVADALSSSPLSPVTSHEPSTATLFTGLNEINLTIPRGALVAVVGKVGSGKSSFLSSLIGEMKRTAGSVRINGQTAYCPQQPWIQNETVRGNILFGLEFDEERYWNAVKAAALERDLEILPDGDQTEIGERGIVSGGLRSFSSLIP